MSWAIRRPESLRLLAWRWLALNVLKVSLGGFKQLKPPYKEDGW